MTNIKRYKNLIWMTILMLSALSLKPAVAGGKCTQLENDPSADVAKHTLRVHARKLCGPLQGQTGCRIYKGQGSCTAYDPKTGEKLFHASAKVNKEGSVDWSLEGDYEADTVLVGNFWAGGACGYFYADDADNGRHLGFLRHSGKFSDVKFVDICSDLVEEPKPEPVALPKLPECPDDIQAALDERRLGDTDIAITYKFDDKVGIVSTFCVRGGFENPDAQVTPCLNEPADGVKAKDEVLCSEVVSPETGLPLELGSENSYDVVGAVGSSCVRTCLPPPLTFGGRAQCSIICR